MAKTQKTIDPNNFVSALVNAPGFAAHSLGDALSQAMQMASKFKLDFGQKAIQQQTAKLDPEQQRQFLINTLKANTIAQTPYTPEAKKYLQSLPVTAYGQQPTSSNKNDLSSGVYSPVGFKQPIPATFAVPQNQSEASINIRYIDPANNPQAAVETLRHEFIHALDANVNKPEDASYPRVNDAAGDSNNFFSKLKKSNPAQAEKIYNHINGGTPLYKQHDPYQTDTESFAYHGGQGASAMLYKGLAPEYSGIYQPVEQAINSSPVFPSQEYIRRFHPIGSSRRIR